MDACCPPEHGARSQKVGDFVLTSLLAITPSSGKAPLSDPCGVAGGYTVATGGGGETPPGAKQGDKGSHLPPTAAAARWTSGATAEVGWMVAANHGGGYVPRAGLYRLRGLLPFSLFHPLLAL